MVAKIGLIKNIFSNDNDLWLVVSGFKILEPASEEPLPSPDIGIFIVCDLNDQLEVCNLKAVNAKYVLLPHGSLCAWIGIPMIHAA